MKSIRSDSEIAKKAAPRLRILMASSEAVPYAKSGGLADMVSALSIALAKEGHEVIIALPRYYGIDRSQLKALEGPMGVPVGSGEEWCKVFTTVMPDSPKENPINVYFIEHERFFGRDGIYGTAAEPDFLDNPQRFTFFSKSIFQLCRKLNWYPDVLHAHDWPTALVPVFLKFVERSIVLETEFASEGSFPLEKQENFSKTVSVLTIHNLGYQGIYYKDNFDYTGLGWETFYNAGFDDYNMMNLLRAGLWSADTLNTVSPNYAEETKTAAYGFRMDGILRHRAEDYRGILNGIDTDIWNPEKDLLIPQPYSAEDLKGKALAKAELQKEFGLPQDPNIPVMGLVSRLTEQKGIGELFGPSYGSAYSICQDYDIQFVLLGSGVSWCENEIRSLTARLSNFKAKIGYNEKLSHLIEAGSDFFLMPSRYEPSGLNQMYSLVYGTIPIVRNTGGLTDTVENFNQETGNGTGFMFDDLTPQAIYNTVGWAVWAWYNRPKQIEAMRSRGMKMNFSWARSAKAYIQMYHSTLQKMNREQ
jgi:starch synthase